MQNNSVSGFEPEGKANNNVPKKANEDLPSPTLDDGDGNCAYAIDGNLSHASPSSSSSRKGVRDVGSLDGVDDGKIAISGIAHEVDVTCRALVELQQRRKFCIKLMTRQTNALGGLIRTALGFTGHLEQAERDKITKRAARIVSAALNGKEPNQEDVKIFEVYAKDFESVAAALAPLEARRKEIVKEMERLARTLPVYPFVKGVKGFGDLGFAVLIGEAGNLSGYPASWIKARDALRKRLGIAPFMGKACSSWRVEWKRNTPKLSAEEWEKAGYKPQRLAEIVSCVTDSLFKAQRESAEKSGMKYGRGTGRYGEIYVKRREHTEITHPDWSKDHAHTDAMRVMTCKLIDDLMREWRSTP